MVSPAPAPGKRSWASENARDQQSRLYEKWGRYSFSSVGR
jgi:hypothetical protein